MNDRPLSPFTALVNLPAVVSLLAGSVTAWATGVWWLLLPTLGLYGWLVRAAWSETGPFGWVEPDLQPLSDSYRRRAESTLDLLRRTNGEMRTAPEFLKAGLSPVWWEVRALGTRQVLLLQQLQSLEGYLRSLSPRDLRALEQELQVRRKSASDPIAARQYEQAQHSLGGQVRNVQELRATVERIEAQVQSVQFTLQHVYGQVLRLKSADLRAGEAGTTELNHRLKSMSLQVDSLSEAVDQVYVGNRTDGV